MDVGLPVKHEKIRFMRLMRGEESDNPWRFKDARSEI